MAKDNDILCIVKSVSNPKIDPISWHPAFVKTVKYTSQHMVVLAQRPNPWHSLLAPIRQLYLAFSKVQISLQAAA